MMDVLLTRNDRAEALSRAYVSAVAAMAGYTISEPNMDRDSVDTVISAGGQMRPSVGAQLKATGRLETTDRVHWKFPLKLKNYNDLRVPTQMPRILIVLDLPEDEAAWLSVSPEQLVIRRSAYWTSLLGSPDSDNETSVTVSIPIANNFDVAQLRVLMEKARKGAVT
jgi:Domain of unknown function (DUF4365)